MRNICILCGDDVDKRNHKMCTTCHAKDKQRKRKSAKRIEASNVRENDSTERFIREGMPRDMTPQEEWNEQQQDKIDTFWNEY